MGRYSRNPDESPEWDPDESDADGPLANEDPEESDMDSHDGPELVACPYCGKMISEDTEICHLCGSFISEEDSRAPIPMWIMIGVILGLIAFTGCMILALIRLI